MYRKTQYLIELRILLLELSVRNHYIAVST